jgi:diguanylate cyclase (GGDEF)-like protein
LDVDNIKLDELSRVDPLTGVSNRRDLDSALGNLLAAPARPIALIVFDVDRFKEFNDAYGHPVGDACLRMVAEQIRASLRQHGDMVARIGGDEFVAVLQEADADTATMTANRVREAIERAAVIEPSTGLERHVTVSAGLAIAEGHATAADLTAVADRALYRAKQLGRNQVSRKTVVRSV